MRYLWLVKQGQQCVKDKDLLRRRTFRQRHFDNGRILRLHVCLRHEAEQCWNGVVKTKDAEEIHGGDQRAAKRSSLLPNDVERTPDAEPCRRAIMQRGEGLWLEEIPAERDALRVHDEKTRVRLHAFAQPATPWEDRCAHGAKYGASDRKRRLHPVRTFAQRDRDVPRPSSNCYYQEGNVDENQPDVHQ
jgi:hypothetical protein